MFTYLNPLFLIEVYVYLKWHEKSNYYYIKACSYHCCLFVSLELLERSLALLNKSQQLTDFIEKIKCDGPNVNAEMIQGAQNSCLKIDSLLELLQDRRRQLDKYLKQQQQELSQVLQMCQWDQQESQVTRRGTDGVLTLASEIGLLCGWSQSWPNPLVLDPKYHVVFPSK